jgi:hypothetical protein
VSELVTTKLISEAKGWDDGDFALRYIDLIRDYVALHIAAGHSPEAPMLRAADMLEAWGIVHVDGAVPKQEST